MNRYLQEFTPPGQEFAPPEGEFTPLPPEFSPVSTPAPARERRKRRYSFALAAIACAGLVFGLLKNPAPETSPTLPLEPVTEPTQAMEVTQAATAPAPAEPGCEIVLIAFSSEIQGKLLLQGTQSILEVRVELWDTLMDSLEREYRVPREDIDGGIYTIPTFFTDELYEKYPQQYEAAGILPDPELRVSIRYRAEEGEQTLLLRQHAQQEQGWGVTYYPVDTPPSEYTYPGCFVLRTYPSGKKVSVIADDPAQTDAEAIRVTVELEGQRISPESFRTEVLELESFRYDENGNPVPDGVRYQTVLIVPRPEAFPENGGNTAVITVSQPLEHYDMEWTVQKELPY